jgi:hypothetical protein
MGLRRSTWVMEVLPAEGVVGVHPVGSWSVPATELLQKLNLAPELLSGFLSCCVISLSCTHCCCDAMVCDAAQVALTSVAGMTGIHHHTKLFIA